MCGELVKVAACGVVGDVDVEQGRALIMRGSWPMGTAPPPNDFTWSLALREQPVGTTRLLVRERYAYSRRWAPLLVEPVAVVSFLMTQRMLRGIRDRAERDGRPAGLKRGARGSALLRKPADPGRLHAP